VRTHIEVRALAMMHDRRVEVEVGSSWAYRARAVDPLVEVRVQKIGTQKPARVLVDFVDQAFEGRQDWVPPNRLKARWADAEAFLARERRWRAVESVGPRGHETVEFRAVEVVFEQLIVDEVAVLTWNAGGVTEIKDPAALALLLDVDPAIFRDHETVFDEDGAVMVPWSVSLSIATQAAARHPEPIADYVDRQERSAQHEAIHGKYVAWSRAEGRQWEPEECVEFDNEYYRPLRELLRSWCGLEPFTRLDELRALRAEVRRLGDLVEDAITKLQAAGQDKDAGRLKVALGVPVEEVRSGSE
jgi:hypothetical protein